MRAPQDPFRNLAGRKKDSRVQAARASKVCVAVQAEAHSLGPMARSWDVVGIRRAPSFQICWVPWLDLRGQRAADGGSG